MGSMFTDSHRDSPDKVVKFYVEITTNVEGLWGKFSCHETLEEALETREDLLHDDDGYEGRPAYEVRIRKETSQIIQN
jgi:hypothetical protein